MPEDDALKKLEARLTRLESALAQGGVAGGAASARPGPITDPGPYPGAAAWGGGWGWGGYRPRPIVDPAAYGGPYRWPGPIVDPGPVVDPVPWPWGSPWGPIGPIVDPVAYQSQSASALGKFGPVGDPPPIDVSRFSLAQLESALHSINAEKARLTSVESMVKQQIEKLKGQQG